MLREELQRIGKGTAGDTNEGARTGDTRMKLLHKLFPLGHCLISLLFVGCGLALTGCAPTLAGDSTLGDLALAQRLHTVLESIAVLTVAGGRARAGPNHP